MIIRAIALAPGAIDNETPQSELEPPDSLLDHSESDELDSLLLTPSTDHLTDLWSASLDEAEDHYYGLGDCIQDYNEALRLFRQAAKLGALPAYVYIGNMYADGEGVREDKKKALEFYKEGARRGSAYCYWAMGMMFVDEESKDNADKCFSLFIRNIPSPLPDTQRLTTIQLTHVFLGCVMLLIGKLTYGKEIPAVLNDFILDNSMKIQERAQGMVDHAHKHNKSEDCWRSVIRHLASITNLPSA
jgi:tetratricopeptide (TPR) repeat protein